MTTLEKLHENNINTIEIEFFPDDEYTIINVLSEADFIKTVTAYYELSVFYINHETDTDFMDELDNTDIDEKICYAEFIADNINGRILRYKDMREVGPGPMQKQTTRKNIHELPR